MREPHVISVFTTIPTQQCTISTYFPCNQMSNILSCWKRTVKWNGICQRESYSICIDKVSAIGYFELLLRDARSAMHKWPWGNRLSCERKVSCRMIAFQQINSLDPLHVEVNTRAFSVLAIFFGTLISISNIGVVICAFILSNKYVSTW